MVRLKKRNDPSNLRCDSSSPNRGLRIDKIGAEKVLIEEIENSLKAKGYELVREVEYLVDLFLLNRDGKTRYPMYGDWRGMADGFLKAKQSEYGLETEIGQAFRKAAEELSEKMQRENEKRPLIGWPVHETAK